LPDRGRAKVSGCTSVYKTECERQRLELREAYMNLNKQQLADSEEFRQQLDSIWGGDNQPETNR
jgi:hypothetical protein